MQRPNTCGASQTTLFAEQKGTFMGTTGPRTEQDEMWRTIFDDNHADLTTVAEMLLRGHLPAEAILRKALTSLETSAREVTFGEAIRGVVETVIEFNRESARSPLDAKTLPSPKLRVPGMSQIATLPWAERSVYFLRGVLHYSCQETAVLLGLSDPQIEQLYKFAAKRIVF